MAMDLSGFNSLEQDVSFLSRNGELIAVPISTIDAFNDETISISINYSFQIGACFIMLLVILIMTPPAKLRRPSSVLHILGLVICIIRMSLLEAFFLSPLNHFYQFWARDYSSVARHYLVNSVVGNVFSLLLVIVIEMALINQAWTMVSLWPTLIKFSLVVISGVISLLAVGWRFAFAVVQSKSDIELVPARNLAWLVHTTLIVNAISICWYCALFNTKLLLHLIVNRGILSSSSALSPMEVLVITNGILMVVPVIFVGLEWGRFPNFEAASLTQASVALILPLGTLAAQQMTRGGSLAYISSGSSGRSNSSSSNSREKSSHASTSASSKLTSMSTTCGSASGSRNCTSLLSTCEAGTGRTQRLDHFDLELQQIDSTSELANDGVRIDTDLEQHETRI